jgi:hypothetical protein
VSETQVTAHIGLPEENPDWMALYAHKCKEFDRAMSQIVTRELALQRVRDLHATWAEQAMTPSTFSPDEAVDRTARGRTGACAEQLRNALRSDSTKEAERAVSLD